MKYLKNHVIFSGNRIFTSVGLRHLIHHLPGKLPDKFNFIIEDFCNIGCITKDTLFFGTTAVNDLNGYNWFGRRKIKKSWELGHFNVTFRAFFQCKIFFDSS